MPKVLPGESRTNAYIMFVRDLPAMYADLANRKLIEDIVGLQLWDSPFNLRYSSKTCLRFPCFGTRNLSSFRKGYLFRNTETVKMFVNNEWTNTQTGFYNES